MLTKKLLLLTGLAAVLAVGSASAQALKAQHIAQPSKTLKSAIKPAKLTGFEPAAVAEVSVPPATVTLRAAGFEEQGGRTGYDLQTNGCVQSRVHEWPDGNVSMAWTTTPVTEPDGSGWPTRGSGYNTRTNWLTGGAASEVDDRIEASVRTGFTNYVVTDAGVEMAVAHTAGPPYALHYARRTGGTGAWTEGTMPTQTPKGVLWCKAAADGENIHVIALTAPTGTFGGVVYKGCNGHILYYRSQDAGLTWNVIDGVIPGIDSSTYDAIGGDSYTITAHNGTVAVGVFDGWGDTKIAKSTDNGSTWETFVALDFPLNKYVFDTPYDPASYGGPYDGAPAPNGVTDTFAIQTNDEKGTVVIDAAGYVHAFFGLMWVSDATPGDAQSSYYPGTNGIVHWNEALPDDAAIVFGADDLDGDSTLTLNGDLQPYGSACLSSFPTAAADDEGNIYVAYAAVMETDAFIEGNTNLHFRHTFVAKSGDFGATWNTPHDVVFDGDTTLFTFVEAVFPSLDQYHATNKLHLQYQRDFVPGPAVQKTDVQADELSDIVYWGSASIVGSKDIPSVNLAFGLSPNPTSGNTNLTFQLADQGKTMVQIVSITGAVVGEMNQGNLSAGEHNITLNTSKLNNGVYFVRVRSGNQSGVQRLVVMH